MAIVLATVLGSLGACTNGPALAISEMKPASAPRGLAVAVRILGSNFTSAVRANFDDKRQSRVSTTYSAKLGAMELADVTRVSAGELSATVPAGLAGGNHELVVTDSAGRSARLAGAFTVMGDTPDGGGDGDGSALDGSALDGSDSAPDGDARGPDGARPDATRPDATRPDTTRDTVTPTPDLPGPVFVPLTLSALRAAFLAARVPCVDHNGVPSGQDMPIVDTNELRFFDFATVTAPSAPTETRNWVGARAAVSVGFNPNACEGESIFGGNSGWVSACLIVRGARIDAQGRIVLESTVTVADMNIVNCTTSGVMQGGGDFARPTDSDLASSYPQFVNPINAAKKAVIDTAKP